MYPLLPAWRATRDQSLLRPNDGTCRYPFYVRLDDASLPFLIEVEAAGRYALLVHYRCGASDLCQRLLVNGDEYKIGFSASQGRWKAARFSVPLRAGVNDIRLLSHGAVVDDESAPVDVEALELCCFCDDVPRPLFDLPTIAPRENRFYRSVSGGLCYHLRGALPIARVTAAGRTLDYEVDRAAAQDGPLHFTDGWACVLSHDSLSRLPDGPCELCVAFEDGTRVFSRLFIGDRPEPSLMSITMLDVDHGACVLFRLPTGEHVLVDSGYEQMARERVLPFLDANGIARLDAYVVTHYDADHCGAARDIRRQYSPRAFYDHTSFRRYQTFGRGGVTWNVLNAAGDGPEGDVNANSLSFRMSCGGFVYAHGGDIYAPNQRRIALDHPEWVPADVYHGNHHLFGTMDISYLRRCNPVLFLAQVNAHCYGKGDHHDHFIPEVESYLYAHQGRLRETLRAFETGSATLRVMKDGSFTYETFREFDRAREV